MDEAWWGFFGTLVGTVVGAGASILTTAMNSKGAIQLSKASDDFDRAERARAFQRETLVHTQDVIQDLMRLMARAYLADGEAFRRTGQWGQNLLDDELNESMLLANRKLTALVERISDDSLRLILKRLHNRIASVSSIESAIEARAAFHTTGEEFEAAMTQFGFTLRTYY